MNIRAPAPDGRCTHEALASLLWSDRPEPQASDSLKHALADLRARLSQSGISGLEVTRQAIRLDPVLLQTEIGAFLPKAAGDSSSLARAPDLYTGDLLSGIAVRGAAFKDWQQLQRQHRQALAERAAAQLITSAEVASQAGPAFAAASHLARLAPCARTPSAR